MRWSICPYRPFTSTKNINTGSVLLRLNKFRGGSDRTGYRGTDDSSHQPEFSPAPRDRETILMTMRFLTEPMGLLNYEYLLDRADGFFGRARDLVDVPVEFCWPVRLWKRVVEDADALGMTPPQLVRQIVREHYEREGTCDNHEDELLH